MTAYTLILFQAWASVAYSDYYQRLGLRVGRSWVRISSVMWDFSALAGSYPELGVLWVQWEGWDHTAELHPLHARVFESVT